VSLREKAVQEYLEENVATGISPQVIAEKLFAAIKEEKLYVSTHSELNVRVEERMNNILQSLD
jgi:hypothetical protein